METKKPIVNPFIASFTEHTQTYEIYMSEPKVLLDHKIAEGNLVITSDKGSYTSQLLLEIVPECAIKTQFTGMHEVHVTEASIKELIANKQALRTGEKYTIQFFFGTPLAKEVAKNLQKKYEGTVKKWEKKNLHNPKDVVT